MRLEPKKKPRRSGKHQEGRKRETSYRQADKAAKKEVAIWKAHEID